MKFALKIFLLFLSLFLVIAGFSAYWTFFRLVPESDKPVSIVQLQNEVTVHWDAFQVPHITAQTEADAFSVMGYIHARDRLWQMTRMQYKLEGLHSREIDTSMIDLDRFYLTMGFGQKAQEAYHQLSRREQQHLQAYADGVNRFIQKNKKHLPLEFTLSDARPVEWQPWHSIGVQILWAWQHQHSFWTKFAFHPIALLNDDAATRAITGLDVPHSSLFGDQGSIIDSATYQTLSGDFRAFIRNSRPMITHPAGTGFATTGGPDNTIAALTVTLESSLSLPNQYYELGITVGDKSRAGLTIPGFPAMIIGQNRDIAWAITPAIIDDGDFYSGNLFSSPFDGPVDWHWDASIYDSLADDITLERHFLTLKNGAEQLIVTKRAAGMPVVAISESDNRFLAFDWAGFNAPADFDSFLDIATAATPADLESPVRNIQMPGIRVFFVSGQGETGMVSGGFILDRDEPFKIRETTEKAGPGSAEVLFPWEMHSDGSAVFVGDQLSHDGQAEFSHNLYQPPWDRSARIRALMDEVSPADWKTGITNKWHNDSFSDFAATLSPLIMEALEDMPQDSLIDITLPYLQNWNYEYRSNETAATLIELFFIKSAALLYGEFLSEHDVYTLFTSPHIPYSAVYRLLSQPDTWPEAHHMSFKEWISGSMRSAIIFLNAHYGSEPYDWQWGRVLQGTFSQIHFDETKSRSRSARLAERNLFQIDEFSLPGSAHTLNASHYNFHNPFEMTAATSLKRTMFLTPENEFHSILSTGQSGNVFSDHYDDQYPLWKNGYVKPGKLLFPSDQNAIKKTQIFRP